MPNVKFRASPRTLTRHVGLSIIGQCLEITGADSIDSRFPPTLGMRTSDVVKRIAGRRTPPGRLHEKTQETSRAILSTPSRWWEKRS